MRNEMTMLLLHPDIRSRRSAGDRRFVMRMMPLTETSMKKIWIWYWKIQGVG